MPIIETLDDVTPATLSVMERTRDPRLREILISLVKHLHAFAREVRLTEDEFQRGGKLVAALGQQSNDRHNEVVLIAGSLGLSQLVCMMNNAPGDIQTSASLLGPFWRMHSPSTANGESILRSQTPGPPLVFTGRVVDTAGRPVAGAEVDIWHSSPVGLYENQDDEQADMNLRGKFRTDEEGYFSFRSVVPAGYPIPTNGVVGQLLEEQSRHPFRPAHLHALIFKEGYKTISAQIYVPDDPHIDTDVQFGVTRALMGDFVRHDEPHDDVPSPWWSLDHVFVIAPGEAKLPIPPIR
ncbi:MAG TPA: dioxygenase [Novosphingobium sp.]|nr:dioxygenase [Novosphingobium sp.]